MALFNHFLFIIDTDHYAGNFERPMCAYITGEVGECGVGDEAAKAFRDEVTDNPLVDDIGFSIVLHMPTGDYPVNRPCEIYPNPKWFNHGMGGHFRRDDPAALEKALADWKKQTTDYEQKQVDLMVSHASKPYSERHPSWTDEAITREKTRRQKKIDEANATTEVHMYPAYMSVSIFLENRPTPEQIQFLKDRATLFVDYCKKDRWLPDNLQIEGFRLVEVKVDEEGEEL